MAAQMTHLRSAHRGYVSQPSWKGDRDKNGNPVIHGSTNLQAAAAMQDLRARTSIDGSTPTSKQVMQQAEDEAIANKLKRQTALEMGYEKFRRGLGFGPKVVKTPQQEIDDKVEAFRQNAIKTGAHPDSVKMQTEQFRKTLQPVAAPQSTTPATPGAPAAIPAPKQMVPSAQAPANVADIQPSQNVGLKGTKSEPNMFAEQPPAPKAMFASLASPDAKAALNPIVDKSIGSPAPAPLLAAPPAMLPSVAAAPAGPTGNPGAPLVPAAPAPQPVVSAANPYGLTPEELVAAKTQTMNDPKIIANKALIARNSADSKESGERINSLISKVNADRAKPDHVSALQRLGTKPLDHTPIAPMDTPNDRLAVKKPEEEDVTAMAKGGKVVAAMKGKKKLFVAEHSEPDAKEPDNDADDKKKLQVPKPRALGGVVAGTIDANAMAPQSMVSGDGFINGVQRTNAHGQIVTARKKGGKVEDKPKYKVGEKGPELMVSDDNEMEVIGKDGPQVGSFSKPGVVIPHHAIKAMKQKFSKAC